MSSMCLLNEDYPRRVASLTDTVHLLGKTNYTACGLYVLFSGFYNWKRLPNNTEPTCKQCLRVLNSNDYWNEKESELYVIKTEDGLYWRTSKGAKLTGRLQNALLYKSFETAEEAASVYLGKAVYKHRFTGKEIICTLKKMFDRDHDWKATLLEKVDLVSFKRENRCIDWKKERMKGTEIVRVKISTFCE